jgi:predicted DNA-binding protein
VKQTEKIKRHVGRPATGIKKMHVAISLSINLNEKLSDYAKSNNITKAAVVEKSLEHFFSNIAT